MSPLVVFASPVGSSICTTAGTAVAAWAGKAEKAEEMRAPAIRIDQNLLLICSFPLSVRRLPLVPIRWPMWALLWGLE